MTVLSAIHNAERTPSLVFGLIFGVITLEAAMALTTNVLAHTALGSVAWLGIFGGSLIGTGIAFKLVARTHPLAKYLHNAEEEA